MVLFSKPLELVVAMDLKGGIGKEGSIPWKIAEDMAYFKKLTSTTEKPDHINAVIMGRKTWESIPEKFRPLPDRYNIVLSRSGVVEHLNTNFDSVAVFESLDAALASLAVTDNIDRVFVIGGGEIYREALPKASCAHVTAIRETFDCDVFFPHLFSYMQLITMSPLHISAKTNIPFVYKYYTKYETNVE